ncbi:VOC family protein [Paraflavitalea speifideaquila]|uniref:VOC family protein n=1 Tax=Paraflavitalea speifideaquila TaxID=3076558 RepID=UPI0028EFC363|nr:VOC family protein [Paraflavitalea speifideiaquila]
MISINPYLNFLGNTEEAMNFYRPVFGGQFAALERFKDSPGYEKMPEEEWEKIMHIRLPMGPKDVIMATDALASMGQTLTKGNNFYIRVSTESEAETNKFFKALSAGGTLEMPLNNTFWGAYCGMCTDKFGIQWMINFDLP